MATHIWRKVKSGTLSARVFSAYLALVLAVAVIGPGLAVYGSEGSAPAAQPEELVVSADEVAEVEPEPVVESDSAIEPQSPVDPEPAVVPAPAIVEMPPAVAEPSVEIMNTASVVTPPAVLVPLALSSDPSGLGIVPTLVEGNPDLTAGGVRVNPPFTDAVAIPGHPGMFVTVTVASTDDGQVFSFSSDVPVVRVVAKGGNVGANIYEYAPAVYGDSSLHAPVNPSGKYADLSHIDFYFGAIPEEPEAGDLIVYKFHDLDEDGVYDDGEPMLEDWEFTLTQSTPPIVDVSAIALIGSGLTDVDGELLFSALEPGDYAVTETLKAGWTNTTPLSQDVTVVDGQTAELWFGNIEDFVPYTDGEIIVHKFHDLDEDGVYDDGEPMLEGWEFTLSESSIIGFNVSAVVDSGLTDAAGELLFDELPLGDYTVTETLQDGWFNTTPLSQDVTVVEEETAHLWFGNAQVPEDPKGDLVVYKFHDLDEDGVYDDGEPMLEGWEFAIEVEGVEMIGLVDVGLTDADGELLFGSLDPGEYMVTEVLQEGWANTTPLTQGVTVVDGQTAQLWFGNIEIPEEPEGDLVVYKFHDLDEDGVHDEGEPMLKDWEFTLTQSTPPPIVDASAIALIGSGLTDAHGELFFSSLDPGTYTVTEVLQEGWANTTPLTQGVTVVDGQTAQLWFGNIEDFVPFTELDLAITKTVDKPTAKPGELLTYTLTYWNTSDVVAYDFAITDDFDQRYVTVVNAAGGTVADGKIVWSLAGPLAQADGKQTITYTARVIATMPVGTTNIDNVVVIEHPDDSDPTNNTDRARTVVKIVRDEEPFLPFTGGEYLLLIGLAAVAATAGAVLRLRDRTAA